MKKIDLTAIVPENSVDELSAEIKEIIENKYGGKVKNLSASNPQAGSGAMLRSVG